MSTRKRKDQPLITNEMLDVCAEHRALKCSCEPEPENFLYYDVPDECPACRRGAELNHTLLRMLNLPCYEVYAVPPVAPGEGFLRREEAERAAVFEQALAEREAKP
jgi:hypothetical protein